MNNYRYTGEQFDPNAGFYYLRARYYDQMVGRFTQMDAWLGNELYPITLNKFLYANADPVIFIDPSGNIAMLSELMAVINVRGTQSSSATATYRVTLKKTGKEVACIAIEEIISDLILQQLTG